jgi:hypothetical protein
MSKWQASKEDMSPRKNYIPSIDDDISDEIMSTFVVNLDENDQIPVPEGGELLITVFDNKICRVAWRPKPWTSWGPPAEGEKRA